MIHAISTFTHITVVQVEIFGNFWKMSNVYDNDSIVTVDPIVQIQCFGRVIEEQILMIQALQETLEKIEMVQVYNHFKLVMYLNLNKFKCTVMIMLKYYIMYTGINSVIIISFEVGDGLILRDEATKETCDEFLFGGDDLVLFCLNFFRFVLFLFCENTFYEKYLK